MSSVNRKVPDMISRRELRRPRGLLADRHFGGASFRRGSARHTSERHGLRRGHCALDLPAEPALPDGGTDGGPALDRTAAIARVRRAADGYCLLVALADAGVLPPERRRRQWLKSASRLIRFAHLLESDGIRYSPALAAVLARLLRDPR